MGAFAGPVDADFLSAAGADAGPGPVDTDFLSAAGAGPVDADFGESTSGCAQCVLLNRRCVPEIIAPRARVAEPSLVFTLGQAFEHLIPTNRFLFHWMFVGRISIGGFGNELLHDMQGSTPP